MSKDRFYCWSGEASGDVITWMIQRENLDFKTAACCTAVMAGVDVGGPPHSLGAALAPPARFGVATP